jgi:uncharacterized protein YciI
MFITLLKFAGNRAAAPKVMALHNEWIAKGFADGVFLCVGSLTSGGGGAIVAHEDHEARVAADPFVMQGIVDAEIYEVDPKRTAEALDFLSAAT